MIFRRWQYGAVFQRDHRDRCAPVTLTGNAPVAQTVVDLTLAHAFGGQLIGNGIEGRVEGQTVKFTRVKQDAFIGHRLFGKIRLRAIGCQDNRLNG